MFAQSGTSIARWSKAEKVLKIMESEPDLIVLETAANDGDFIPKFCKDYGKHSSEICNEGDTNRSPEIFVWHELFVRRLMDLKFHGALVYLISARTPQQGPRSYFETQAYMSVIASYYDFPVISYKDAIAPLCPSWDSKTCDDINVLIPGDIFLSTVLGARLIL